MTAFCHWFTRRPCEGRDSQGSDLLSQSLAVAGGFRYSPNTDKCAQENALGPPRKASFPHGFFPLALPLFPVLVVCLLTGCFVTLRLLARNKKVTLSCWASEHAREQPQSSPPEKWVVWDALATSPVSATCREFQSFFPGGVLRPFAFLFAGRFVDLWRGKTGIFYRQGRPGAL